VLDVLYMTGVVCSRTQVSGRGHDHV